MSKQDCLRIARELVNRASNTCRNKGLGLYKDAAIYFLAAEDYKSAVACFNEWININTDYSTIIKCLKDQEIGQKFHSLLFAKDSPILDEHLLTYHIEKKPFFEICHETAVIEILVWYVKLNCSLVLKARKLLCK